VPAYVCELEKGEEERGEREEREGGDVRGEGEGEKRSTTSPCCGCDGREGGVKGGSCAIERG